MLRFDEDFRFKLTREEVENLRSKNLTSSWGGSRYLPYAFTEQRIYMLMTVLKGDLAYNEIYQQAKNTIFIVDNYIGNFLLTKQPTSIILEKIF